jgi:hypothetical protein
MRSLRRHGQVREITQGFVLLLGSLLAWPAPGSAGAQEAPPPDVAEEAQTPALKISIHGYLSQAYARSNGHQMIGISEQGTTDYRAAAIQVRADITDHDAFIVQLSHERLGESPLMAFHKDVELDWIFYEHAFGDSTVKVGRVQIPFGIYNEVRDVGTILPFYRPSLDFYGEGSFNSETVDGIVLSHTFGPWGAWSLDGDLHYGDFQFVGSDTEYFLSDARGSRGLELWLQTPVPGLRIGAGAMRFDVHDTRQPSNLYVPWSVYHVSATATFGRLAADTEYSCWDEGKWGWETFYVHLGYELTERLTLNGQLDTAHLEVKDVDFRKEADNDKAFGIDYAFRPDLVLKAEHHWNRGYYTENPLADVFAPPLETRFWILSLSTSF